MKILLCGGGTGGHITPILAIAHEIKKQQPDSYIIYIGERGGKFSNLTKNVDVLDEVRTIYGGKLRRYHNQSWIKTVLDIKTNLSNLRDVVYVLVGYSQAKSIIKKTKPDAILIKGGYVGVPVGLAAASKKIPYITHDSDATQSLTTKIVGKWATFNATGMPERLYPYPKHKIRFVGVPVAPEYQYVTNVMRQAYRKDIDIPEAANLLTITGGSLGAIRLNQSVALVISQLFEQINDLYVIHQIGKGNNSVYENYSNPRLKTPEFISNLYKYTGAADIVITRSGATTIAELAVQGKATIIIPNPELTGGQQTKNAKLLASNNAAAVIYENDLLKNPDILVETVVKLFKDKEKQIILSKNIHQEAIPNSASKIAMLLLSLDK
jgi:UDP-N-acetylglucosamine--N-acetylmuramyl-(pentapeptide) pyrophosphoryl-undecaprenol N-acetylglucosamine transferase